MIKLTKAEYVFNNGLKISFPEITLGNEEELLLTGNSGSGKTTLMNIIGGLLKPTNGQLYLHDKDFYDLPEHKRDKLRGRHIGIIFQKSILINSLTVQKNLELVRYTAGLKSNKELLKDLMQSLDIYEKRNNMPEELSTGEKQRVGIARAFAIEPDLVLADEPTSSLDDERTEQVMMLLKNSTRNQQASLLVTTHDQRVKRNFSNIINLQ